MKVTGPPCPCPVCGHVHPSYEFTSPHSSGRGGGRASLARPEAIFKMNMSKEDVDSAIYGDLWKSLVPHLPCRPIPEQELARIHGNPLSGWGQTETPKPSIGMLLIAGLAVAVLFG